MKEEALFFFPFVIFGGERNGRLRKEGKKPKRSGNEVKVEKENTIGEKENTEVRSKAQDHWFSSTVNILEIPFLAQIKRC